MRERMVQHRADPACAACHQLMDPIGLSLEHFDAIGRWRPAGEGGAAIDVSGALFGAVTFDDATGLRKRCSSGRMSSSGPLQKSC
jgi:hypothetical protein